MASPVESNIEDNLATLAPAKDNDLTAADSLAAAAECVPKHGRCSKHEQCCSKRCAVSRLWPGFCWDDDMEAGAKEIQAREDNDEGHCFANDNKCYGQDNLCCSGSCQCPDQNVFKCTCGDRSTAAAAASTADTLGLEGRSAKSLLDDFIAARQVDPFDDRLHCRRSGAYCGNDGNDVCCSKNCYCHPDNQCFCAEGHPPSTDTQKLTERYAKLDEAL